MNPYDNNPFETDNTNDTRSEFVANLSLKETCELISAEHHAMTRVTRDPRGGES